MTTKTQNPNMHEAPAVDVDSVGTEEPTAPETTASAYSALQAALAEVGEELDRHQRTAAEQLERLQKKLAELSQQMELVAASVQSKLAALDSARRAAEESAAHASAAAATQQARAPTPPAADVEGRPEAPEAASSSRVAEMPVAATPPPKAAPTTAPQPIDTQPVAAPAAAAHPAPVAARPVRQAIAAPRAAAAHIDPGMWERIVFGESLAQTPAFAADRASLLHGLEEQDDHAVGLVGQLMIFNAASAERMPQLLKDVGEAYYAWRPQAGHDNFRDALIAYLGERCEAAGVGNTIELVRPGDRFDAMRHNSKQRGVEIVDVFGWVVLRDNGKVYTKASVAVK